jgi:hypothetical protein
MLSNKIKNMKNIVSFETAKKLEAAGIERPTPEIGQFWHDDNQCTLLISSISRGYAFAKYTHDQALPIVMIGFEDFNELVYAPTATDILEQLPDCKMWHHGGFWFVEKLDREFANENAAEAVAEAYLSQSKQ